MLVSWTGGGPRSPSASAEHSAVLSQDKTATTTATPATRPAPAASAFAAAVVESSGGAPVERTCAGKRVDVDAQGNVRLGEGAGDESREMLRRGLTVLRQHLQALPREQARAVSLMLDAGVAGPAPLDGAQARNPGAALEALADLASRSTDPVVYAVAFQMCQSPLTRPWPGGPNTVAACAGLSAAQWARLEPDNGEAWLYHAEASRAGRDTAGVAESLYQVAQARRFDAHFRDVAQRVMSLLPLDTPPDLEAALAVSMLGVESAAAQPGYQMTSEFCSVNAVRDVNRAQTCAGIATALVEGGSRLLDLAIGGRIGERVGWPAGEGDAIRKHTAALQQALHDRLGDDIVSCDGARRHAAYFRDRAALGELQAMRRAQAARH